MHNNEQGGLIVFFIKFFKELSCKGCFAGADIADYHGKTFFCIDGILEFYNSLSLLGAIVVKPAVYHIRKRVLAKLVKFQIIHLTPLSEIHFGVSIYFCPYLSRFLGITHRTAE